MESICRTIQTEKDIVVERVSMLVEEEKISVSELTIQSTKQAVNTPDYDNKRVFDDTKIKKSVGSSEGCKKLLI